MTRKPSCHLIDMLAEVPDPRNNKGKRHPLKSILVLIVIGLMLCSLSKTITPTFTMIYKNFFKAFLIHFLRTRHIHYWETLFTRTRLMKNHMGELRQGVSKQAQVSTHIWTGQG